MKSSVLLLAIAAVVFGSCSTVYKTGQTPDDVYYSPARQTEEYVEVKKDEYRSRGYEYDNPDDRYLRMKVRNPYRWNSFDDYYYNDWAYNPHGYSSYNPFYSWNTYWSWNSYYNPYCRNIVVVNPKTSPTVYGKVRNFNMGTYVNNNPKPANTKTGVRPVSRYNNSNYNNSNSNNNNSLGTSIRKVFSGGNSNSNSGGSYSTSSSNDRPTRTYNPSSGSSSSGSSSSGSSGGSKSGGSSGGSSGGGVSRPGRGG